VDKTGEWWKELESDNKISPNVPLNPPNMQVVVIQQNTQPTKANFPDVQTPTRQVWFMGNRIWNPKGTLLLVSLFLSLFSTIGSIIGISIAAYCIREGDLRGIPIIIINSFLFILYV